MSEKCKECGCACKTCYKHEKLGKRNSDIHLHAEIENLHRTLAEKNNHIVKMETQFLNDADRFPNGELASIKEELRTCQDKFNRLFDAHKRIQKINQNLEDKLLIIVDKCETEKGAFTKDIATLSHRLADANYTIHRLSQDNSKYRNDVNLAIQLLQCKPSNFVGQKYDSLPSEVQAKVKTYISQKRRSSDMSPVDVKSITVPISTFPPTAMVYNISKQNIEKHSDDESDDNKSPIDIVSSSIMAKVLEDRERERIFAKHCDTCVCHKTILMVDSECQTIVPPPLSSTTISKTTSTPMTTMNYQDNNTDDDDIDNNYVKKNQINGYTPIRQSASQTKIQINEKNIQKLQTIKLKSKLNKQTSELHTPLLKNNTNDDKLLLLKNINDNVNYDVEPIDIINDRLWKNSWIDNKKLIDNKILTNDNNNLIKQQKNDETSIDVINERVWIKSTLPSSSTPTPTTRTSRTTRKTTINNNSNNKLTHIEVKNIVDGHELTTTTTTTSPSFSSDSIVISSSEPSSSSSDLLHINNKKLNINNNNLRINQCDKHELLSKNILLDNARNNYDNVVYTSSGSLSESVNFPIKSTTALVHHNNNTNNNNKLTRTLSTSSDETFPTLPHDAGQLQRVAEWVKSSVSNPTTTTTSTTLSSKKIIKNKPLHTLIDLPADITIDRKKNQASTSCTTTDIDNKFLNKNNVSLKNDNNSSVKDLITFDSTNEDEADLICQDKNVDCLKKNDYEVKMTKEMKDTYLTLAACLDPVSLSLSTSCTNSNLTIENYRKDHKKNQLLQKSYDKNESTT